MKLKFTTRGFTLIELLVAIGVLALVAVLGWRGLDGIIRARVKLNTQLEQTRGMQLTFAQMQSDCANVAPLTVIGVRPQILIDGERLRLVRTVYADDQPTRLEVVVYRLDNGVLSRRESAATRDLKELDALWSSTAQDGDNAQPVVLQAGVDAMSMRLWVGNGPWQTENAVVKPATPGQTGNGIRGLEVTLKSQGGTQSMQKVFLVGAV
ncbi:MAG: prepilin-type N-terminal cleavage/methylation domain-containing protein [Burkholderiaceae bacterium]|nr:prepilin-type N-terminal cleavage/methylation domain-containing protein [Burkholderiaceae bacterium]